jgi:DNA-binding NarL/FixJ family response regulator
MAIRVLLVDDHQVVLEGLRSLLAADPGIEVVGTATSGEAALELAEKLSPDAMVLDVTMPGLNGIETMRRLRELSPETEVIALSMHAAGQVVTDMLRAGASGYMSKTGAVSDLPKALRTIMTGATYLSDDVAASVPRELQRKSGEAKELTAREREVLALVAEGKSSKEIANQLYVTEKTIVFHRQSIMEKLGLRTVAELTKYAIRMGLTKP